MFIQTKPEQRSLRPPNRWGEGEQLGTEAWATPELLCAPQGVGCFWNMVSLHSQAGLELTDIQLPLFPKSWDHRLERLVWDVRTHLMLVASMRRAEDRHEQAVWDCTARQKVQGLNPAMCSADCHKHLRLSLWHQTCTETFLPPCVPVLPCRKADALPWATALALTCG